MACEKLENDLGLAEDDVLLNAPGIQASIGLGRGQFLPEYSRVRYEEEYNKFCEWCKVKNVEPNQVSDDVFLSYISEKSKEIKPSTLWSRFSMIKTCLKAKENLSTLHFPKTVAFLKHQSVGYIPNRGSVFTDDEITKFMIEAPDNEWLLSKVILVFYIFGACRRDELINLSVDDVKDSGSFLTVFLKEDKVHNLKSRNFTITDGNFPFEACNLVRKYLSLRPIHMKSKRFLVAFRRGRCFAQHVGCHAISGIPQKVAKYLRLENPSNYKGSAVRNSSILVKGSSLREFCIHHQKFRPTIESQKIIKSYCNSEGSIDCNSRIEDLELKIGLDLPGTRGMPTKCTPELSQNPLPPEILNTFKFVNVNHRADSHPNIKEEILEAELPETESMDEEDLGLSTGNIEVRMEANLEKNRFALNSTKCISTCSIEQAPELFGNKVVYSNQQLESCDNQANDFSYDSKNDDECEWFGAYVATSLRALRHESSQKRLKSLIHNAIKEVNNIDKLSRY